jgi:hypothetical protein
MTIRFSRRAGSDALLVVADDGKNALERIALVHPAPAFVKQVRPDQLTRAIPEARA